jgi:hypothetical protein
MKNIELALNDGTVTWEGLARNVEYLDIRDDMRQFLGRWYARRRSPCDESDSDESSDSEEDGIFSPVENAILDPDTDADVEDEDDSDEEDKKCASTHPIPSTHITKWRALSKPNVLVLTKPERRRSFVPSAIPPSPVMFWPQI